MSQLITPFDTIESAQDFVRVLAETIAEAKQEIEVDLERELNSQAPRRREALRIAAYNLDKLENHMIRSRRILNDLRSLRRLLFAEREFRHLKGLSDLPAAIATPEVIPAVVAAIPAPKPVGVTRFSASSDAARAVSA